jgi:predicted O-methyltransferase YrrM
MLAQELYQRLGLSVELIEMMSLDGLRALIRAGRTFNLVYIDGSHEKLWPVIDLGLSIALLRPGGLIALDDHMWPDVEPIKVLCDRHLKRIQETWKTASYQFEQSPK